MYGQYKRHVVTCTRPHNDSWGPGAIYILYYIIGAKCSLSILQSNSLNCTIENNFITSLDSC